MIYEPREDSFLLEKYVKKLAFGKVLDMGTGSGIQTLTALEKTKDVLAVDIDDEAVEFVKKLKIKAIKSDLFENIKCKFDLIIFNAPYLPDSKYKDAALDGGKNGYEVIERFLKDAQKYLRANGKILLVYSSLSKPMKIKQIIKEKGVSEEILEEKKLGFEELYVVKLERKDF